MIFTALMVITFALTLLITNTPYGAIGWVGLLVMNVGGMVYLSLK